MEEDLKVYSIEIICSEPVIILVIIVKKKVLTQKKICSTVESASIEMLTLQPSSD